MDPVSAIGLASALLTFIELTAQIAKRLEELSHIGDVPKVFRDTRARLPLIIDIVTSIKDSSDALSSNLKRSVDTVVNGSLDLVRQLEQVLLKVTVSRGDSRWKRGYKAMISFAEEGRVQRISLALRDNIQILTSLNITAVTGNEKPLNRNLSPPPAYRNTQRHFLVPFDRDKLFIGRQQVLEEIDAAFAPDEPKRVALAGMGGVGKSQVAIEYAYRFATANPQADVFWIYGGSLPRFYQGYKNIAQSLNLPSWDDPDTSLLELVLNWLEQKTSPYLLILDNADNIVDYWPGKYLSSHGESAATINLAKYLPSRTGRLLITSRDKRIASRLVKSGKPIMLRTLTESQASSLFLSYIPSHRSPETDVEVERLVRALDCLPLAITQAASFICENNISPADYLISVTNNDPEKFLNEEINDSRRDEEGMNSAFRAWKVSFDQIVSQKPQAADLLFLMAMFDRQSIPRWLLKMPGAVTSLGILQAFHMVITPTGSDAFTLHRLTQLFVQTYVRKIGQLEHWKDQALEHLSNIYPTEIGISQWSVCEALAPHVQTLLEHSPTSPEAQINLANLLCWAADYDVERGMYAQALERAKRSLDMYRSLVSESDERLAAAAWLYGRLLFYEADSEDDIRDAEAQLQRSLTISAEHSLVHAESAFELAYLYYRQDKESECLKMAKEAFECWKGIEGADSVRTLDERHDFALQLAMFDHEDEAIANWQDILHLTSHSNAVEDTKKVFIYRSTACIAEFQKDHQVAEDLYAKLVELCSAIYNPEHVHVFDYQLSHAEQILRQGRYQEAIDLSEAIRQRCRTRSEWRITTGCLQLIAECYRLTGDFALELEFRDEYLSMCQKKLGTGYQEIYNAMESAARCLYNGSDYTKAETLCGSILDWRRSTLGKDHPDTVTATELHAICLMKLGRYHDATQALRQGYADALPDNLNESFITNICIALRELEDWDDALQWCQRGIDMITTSTTDFEVLAAALRAARDKCPTDAEEAMSTLTLNNNGRGARTDIPQIQLPPFRIAQKPRFGRIIHPRTWSS